MAQNPRARKLEERILQVVANLLQTRIKDPRLGFVTITDVRVTGDLQHASVFYTVYGDEERREVTARGLASARGLIRSEVGRATGLRLTPTIEFILDALPETVASMEQALAQAAARDAELAALAADSQYAGESDPYRTSPETQEARQQDGPAAGEEPGL